MGGRRAGEPEAGLSAGVGDRADATGGADKGYVDLGYAKADTARGATQGAGEVIFGQGKTAAQIEGIARALLEAGQSAVLVTRVDPDKSREVASLVDQSGGLPGGARLHLVPDARALYMGEPPAPDGVSYVAVCAAGTSDLYCAEEAALAAEMMGSRVRRLYDVGVAGIHRLLDNVEVLRGASAVVAAAGMEGALPSVVAGLVRAPVIAVPTSVGYGASFGGLAALLAMLNSCASGVSVVNIDNGFGAGYQAAQIDHVRVLGTAGCGRVGASERHRGQTEGEVR